MKLYNTLTRQNDEIVPSSSPIVSVYTCGPTVYDYAHIGHWFTYVRMDTLVRALKASGLQPKWVMNITDVGHLVSDADDGEDKLEKGARREGKTAWEVAQLYTDDFLEGMRLLNISKPDYMPKATDHIGEQIELIQVLEAKGYTYVIDDGVYYDTSKFEGYAAFARLDLDDQRGSGRVATNPQKKNPQDFALWKFSPKDEKRDMEWDSPWGKGFPGWHIECSAMSMKYLGDTLDIHTGGIDHLPVHHTNEIAQSEAATGKRFAQHWMHGNHVMVNGEKISKSLGNGIRLQEIIEKGISPEAIRLHILESHYRSQAMFSLDNLVAAQNRLNHWREVADLVWQLNEVDEPESLFSLDNITSALTNDLNTPEALTLIDAVLTLIEEAKLESPVGTLKRLLDIIESQLGIVLLGADVSDDQKLLLQEREQVRLAKDFTKSDQIRDQLLAQNIGIRDTDRGQIWFRT